METVTGNSGIVEGGGEDQECPASKTEFENNYDLKPHMNTHTKGETLHQQSTLHNRSLCHKRFRHRDLLRKHPANPLVHHDVKPSSKWFSSRGSLQRHRSVHSYVSVGNLCSGNWRKHRRSLKRYGCLHCHKSFLHKYQLTKHMQNRENSRQCHCKHCQRKFCTSHDLIVHTEASHTTEDITEQGTKDKGKQHVDNKTATEDQSSEESLNEQLQRIEVHDQIQKEIKSEGTASPDFLGQLENDYMKDTDANIDDRHPEKNINDSRATQVPKEMIKPQMQKGDAQPIRSIFGDHRTKRKPVKCTTSNHNDQELSETVMSFEPIFKSNDQSPSMATVNGKRSMEETALNMLDCFKDNEDHSSATANGAYQKQAINICSQDNYKLRAASGSYTQSEQLSCVVKICGENGISVQTAKQVISKTDVDHDIKAADSFAAFSSCTTSVHHTRQDVLNDGITDFTAQQLVSKSDVVHSGQAANASAPFASCTTSVQHTTKDVLNDGTTDFTATQSVCNSEPLAKHGKPAEQIELNKKDVLISGGMPSIQDVCNTYAGACEQRTDKRKAFDDYLDKAVKTNSDFVSVQYDPVDRYPTTCLDEGFSLEKSSFEVQFGPLTLDDTLATDKMHFGHANFESDHATTKATVGHAVIGFVTNETENIEGIQYGPPTLEDMQYGPANMFDDQIVQQSSANVEETWFPSENNCLAPSQFGPSGSSVYYGPPNRNDVHFGLANNDNNQLTLNDRKLQNDDADMKRVQYGPLNLNELEYDQTMIDDQLRATGSFEIPYGPKNWDEMEVDSTNLSNEQYGPANFNEITSINEIPFGPANIDEITTSASDLCDVNFKPSNFQEEQFVAYGPPNIYDLKDDYFNSPEKLSKGIGGDVNDQANPETENSETDCLNSSLIEFPHLNEKSSDQSEIFPDHSVMGNPTCGDYTTVGGLNLGPVHELTDMIVNSCMKADPSDSNKVKTTGLQNGDNLSAGNVPKGTLPADKYSPLVESESIVADTYPQQCTVNSEKLDSSVVHTKTKADQNVGTGYHLETVAATSKLCSIINASPIKQLSLSKKVNVSLTPATPAVCIFSCEICNERIGGQENMTKHKLKHSQSKPYACKICLKTFIRKDNFRIHYKLCKVLNGKNAGKNVANSAQAGANNHNLQTQNCTETRTTEMEFACNICKASFPQQNQLKKHALIHLKEVQTLHKCELCNAVFRHKGTLQAHLRTHTGEKPYKCSLCEKGFAQNSQLTLHVRSQHTNNRPFVCQQCNKTFSDKSHYQRHVLTHSGERPHVCEVCSRAFSQRSQLKTHAKTHSDVKEHVCEICQKHLSTKHSLKKHLATHEKLIL